MNYQITLGLVCVVCGVIALILTNTSGYFWLGAIMGALSLISLFLRDRVSNKPKDVTVISKINKQSEETLAAEMAKQTLVTEMADGVNMIMTGIFTLLSTRLKRTYPDCAPTLAAAVVNEMFFRPQPAQDFCLQYYHQIREEIRKLSDDEGIKAAFTQAIRVNTLIHQQTGMISTQEGSRRLEHCLKRGLLIQGGNFPTPPTFLPFAEHFLTMATSNH